MAKVVEDKQSVVAPRWWNGTEGALIGLGVGFLWWLLVTIFLQYVLDTSDIASGVAHVLVGVGALFTLIRYRVPRPLLVVLSSAIVLWSLGIYIDGLAWWESVLWAMGFYTLSYGLFSMVAHIRNFWLSIAAAVVIVLTSVVLLSL